MRKTNNKLFLHIINIVTVALTIECFLCSLLAVRVHARENCYDRIEEITVEMSCVLEDEIEKNFNELSNFAALISKSIKNQDGLIESYMDNFLETRSFSELMIYKHDGTVYPKEHGAQVQNNFTSFSDEAARLPYVSEAKVTAASEKEGYFYQAVPIMDGEQVHAILYGYLSLDVLEDYIKSTAFDGKCKFYLIDGRSGDFIMDTNSSSLENLDIFDNVETKFGFITSEMKDGIRTGKSGHYVFRSQDGGEWLYSYYMPTSINKWTVQITIDESTAFTNFKNVETIVLILAICVIVLMFSHVFVLMLQSVHTSRRDKERLQRTRYMNDIQRCLLNAHNNLNFIEQALKIIADEMGAETVMLLNINDKTVRNAYYWPSKDKSTVMNLVGRNVRDDFPIIFDCISENNNFIFYPDDEGAEISSSASSIFEALDVGNVIIVPIMDNSGALKGAICVANMSEKTYNCDPLECVTYDFFMAITNVENLEIIKNMGTMDYLTAVKNRNSYETELSHYATMDADSLACVFIDVNGLHEVNNTQGHKAGDNLLCAVADAVKRAFGELHSYRLGGDEFVAFVPDATEEQIYALKRQIIAELAIKHYYVSIGFEIVEKNEYNIFDIDMLVVESERRMYRSKREFYKGKKLPAERATLFEEDDDDLK